MHKVTQCVCFSDLLFCDLTLCLGEFYVPTLSDLTFSLGQLGTIPLHQQTVIYRPTPRWALRLPPVCH